MKYDLLILDSAYDDLDEIEDWYYKINPQLFEVFEYYFKESVSLILSNPNLFQLKYRMIRVRYMEKFPFGIHYITSIK